MERTSRRVEKVTERGEEPDQHDLSATCARFLLVFRRHSLILQHPSCTTESLYPRYVDLEAEYGKIPHQDTRLFLGRIIVCPPDPPRRKFSTTTLISISVFAN